MNLKSFAYYLSTIILNSRNKYSFIFLRAELLNNETDAGLPCQAQILKNIEIVRLVCSFSLSLSMLVGVPALYILQTLSNGINKRALFQSSSILTNPV